MTKKDGLTGAEIDSRYRVNEVPAPTIETDYKHETKIIGGHIQTEKENIDKNLRKQFA